MATDNDTKPCDSLAVLCGRYQALTQVSADFLGHDSPVLALLEGLNVEFERQLDQLDQKGMLS